MIDVSKTFSFHESQSTLFLQHVLDTKLQQKNMIKSGYSNKKSLMVNPELFFFKIQLH